MAVRLAPLFQDFQNHGFDPWLDRKKLLPGQNWPRSIEEAIETSDFFVPCFSHRSVNKKGGFQAEIRYALDMWAIDGVTTGCSTFRRDRKSQTPAAASNVHGNGSSKETSPSAASQASGSAWPAAPTQ